MRDPMELLDEHFDGLLSEADAAEFCAWIKQDVRHAQKVTDAAMIHQMLRYLLHGRRLLEEEAASLGDPLANSLIMPAIQAEIEIETLAEAPSSPVAPVLPPPKIQYWKWAAAIALPLILGVMMWAILRPAKPKGTIAIISGPAAGGTVMTTASATWDSNEAPHDGRFWSSGPLFLTAGLAQLRLDNGVVLIAQGPSRFQLLSQNSVSVTFGKLTVSVPPNADGFAVETPSARTVDLGTEFGVLVDSSGDAETHVIKGTVEMGPSSGGSMLRLTADRAGRVDYGAGSVQPIPCRAGDFVLDIPAIDLADVVAGGDGTQHLRDNGIDALTGKPSDDSSNNGVVRWAHGNGPGDGAFHRCPGRPLIGGVFVPHGGATPDTLDPAGHRYTFPATDGHTYFDLWAGALPRHAAAGSSGSAVRGGVDYTALGHGAVTLHSNKGVTFDLEAMRKAHPDRPFSHLRAVCGNLTALDKPDGTKMSDRSEFWVFVDGQLRLHRLIHRTDPSFDVDVVIGPSAHYLTLVATDGQDGYQWDWVALGDPALK
jgi:FecR protein